MFTSIGGGLYPVPRIFTSCPLFFVAPPSELLLFFWFLKDIHNRDLNDNFNRKRGQQKIDTLCNLQHSGQCTGDSLDKKDYSRHMHEL